MAKKTFIFVIFLFLSSTVNLAADQEPIPIYRKIPEKKFPVYQKLIGENDQYFIWSLQMDLALNPAVKMEFWELKSENNKPTIIILPILGGEWKDKISDAIGKKFSKDNYNILLIKGERMLVYETNISNKKELLNVMNLASLALEERISAIEYLMDWLENCESVQKNNFAVVGVSMGAIEGTILCGDDKRIKVGVLILGGEDIAYILTKTKEPSLKKFRKNTLKNCAISKKEFYDITREAFFSIDPDKFALNWDKDTILMFSAIFDKVIPRKSTIDLYNTGGKPKRIRLFAGHITSAVYYPYIINKSKKHIKKNLT